MKRFYCSICKRVKRVRKMPRQIAQPNAVSVLERVGMCNRHFPATKRKAS